MIQISTEPSRTGLIEEDWPTMEANYWHDTKKARDREDARLAHEHSSRQELLDQGLTELYNKKLDLQKAMNEVNTNIESQMAEKQRLSHEYETRMAILLSERQDEDRSQHGWFARIREGSLPDKENTIPKDNNESNALNHEPTPPNPVGSWTSINGTLRRSSRVQEQRRDPGNLFGSVFHNPVEETAIPNSHAVPLQDSSTQLQPDRDYGAPTETSIGAPEGNTAGYIRDGAVKPKPERHSLPAFPTGNEMPSESSVGSRRSSRGRKSLPSAKDSASQMNSPAAESGIMDDQEITRDCLILKYNGSTIVYPPMYAGVPLEKISQQHPFWNPEWESLESTVQLSLDKWKERLQSLRQKPDVVRHTMFLANRQVNRGQAVLDFLNDGCFHPLQFASREMMDKFYKTFINYDTVFRLVNVHEELKKFDLDVTPLEWLRHRLYEIAMAQGDKFSLSKTTHDLYHDIKLKYLREKHGFGNIGRPSGYKLSDKDRTKGAAQLKPKKESIGVSGQGEGERRRRTRRSIGQVDGEDPSQRPAVASNDYLEPVTPRLQKRQRLDVADIKQEDDDQAGQGWEVALADLECDGYSSRDSFSNGRIMHMDFRVYQIKTQTLMTRLDVTQYWTWKPDENKFEHQVLGDVDPITWAYYQHSHKFNCTVEEMTQIRYASDGLKILVVRAHEGKGDILVFFKRERTKRRFLTFVKKRGVKLVKSTRSQLDEAWNAMNSEMMSEGEAEA